MPELVKVLVLGATSYQGSMLVRPLLAHKNRFTVTAIEKAGDSAKKLKEDGCAIVEGDPESSAVLQKAAKDADVVFSLSFADKLEPVKALVGAIKAKGVLLLCCSVPASALKVIASDRNKSILSAPLRVPYHF
jgi:uncharacterized protein YbjT (DUF2867 family)